MAMGNIIISNIVLQEFIYPENVAYPVGGPGNPRYVVIEMHYDNPNQNSGNSKI